MDYQELLRSFRNSLLTAEEVAPAYSNELELQSRWFAGLFGTEFVTADTKEVRILQFGFWNRSAGPDFCCCAVEIDGKVYQGAIELDISIDHWYQHGHAESEAFNDVVLHVVFTDSPKQQFTRTLSNKHVPTVLIEGKTLLEGLEHKIQTPALAIPGRCSTPLESLSIKRIEEVLTEALMYRLRLKAKRISLLHELHGVEQARWILLAESLGYKNNSVNFKMLAQKLPIHELKNYEQDDIIAILFGMAGFLQPKLHQKAPLESQVWIESLWQRWWQLRQKFELIGRKRIRWNLAGNRPVNHPQRRLAALARIAISWSAIAESSCDIGIKKEKLMDLKDDFWNWHYTLTSKKSKNLMQLIGEGRVDDFLVNQTLPLKVLQSDLSLRDVKEIKAPVASDKVRRASERLFGNNPNKSVFLTKAWHHQALIQIYDDFCLDHIEGCENCPFPEQLRDWVVKSS